MICIAECTNALVIQADDTTTQHNFSWTGNSMISTVCRSTRNLVLRHLAKPQYTETNLAKIWRATLFKTFSTEYSDEAYKQFLLSLDDGGKIDLQKDEDSGIATVTINAPKFRNALSGHMMAELRDVVNELANWETGKGLLLCGAGGTFCSGGNLAFMNSILNPRDGYKMSRFMTCTLNRMYNLHLISVALIEGNALGGGMEITTACDFRVATASAKLGFVQARMGLVPGWGGTARLVQLLGRTRALDVLASGHIFKAEEAKDYGLINHVIPETEDAHRAAREWLQQFVIHPVSITQAIKAAVLNGSSRINQNVMAKEEDIFTSVWSATAHRTALDKKQKHK